MVPGTQEALSNCHLLLSPVNGEKGLVLIVLLTVLTGALTHGSLPSIPRFAL